MIRKYFVMGYVLLFLFPALSWGADKIQGNACYTYGDNESLVQAEQMTKTLAIRNAIESYSIFIESTSKVTDLQLSSDLINTISTGQVKRIKILKRLQSGRKICYTIAGYVEPTDIKKAIGEYLKEKSQDVQLQDNGYLRIIPEPSIVRIYILPNRRAGAETLMLESDNETYNEERLRELNISKDDKRYIRNLYVDVQFLKPCIASTLPSKSTSPAPYIDDLLSGRLDSVYPAFRCDYRFKVFVTFFSEQGSEIETVGNYISNTLQDQSKGNIEKLPGEKGFTLFLIPENAKSWKVWVPK